MVNCGDVPPTGTAGETRGCIRCARCCTREFEGQRVFLRVDRPLSRTANARKGRDGCVRQCSGLQRQRFDIERQRFDVERQRSGPARQYPRPDRQRRARERQCSAPARQGSGGRRQCDHPAHAAAPAAPAGLRPLVGGMIGPRVGAGRRSAGRRSGAATGRGGRAALPLASGSAESSRWRGSARMWRGSGGAWSCIRRLGRSQGRDGRPAVANRSGGQSRGQPFVQRCSDHPWRKRHSGVAAQAACAVLPAGASPASVRAGWYPRPGRAVSPNSRWRMPCTPHAGRRPCGCRG